MPRVSQEELYNDKDVVTQILKLKDTVNDYAGGIIENIDVSGNDLVIDWANGESISLPLPNPTGISSVTGTVSGGNLTITFYMTDGSSHAFTCPLTGMATETYVNVLDAQNVKLTGAQSVAGEKTFSSSPIVPDMPTDYEGAVNVNYVNDSTGTLPNNIVHKDGPETVVGLKTFSSSPALTPTPIVNRSVASATAGQYRKIAQLDKSGLGSNRTHILIGVNSRLRAWGMDTIMLYTQASGGVSNMAGLFMQDRKNTSANYTYVVSEDSSYIYVYILATGGTGDDTTSMLLWADDYLASQTFKQDYGASLVVNAPEGTEYGRLTP